MRRGRIILVIALLLTLPCVRVKYRRLGWGADWSAELGAGWR
jgi:hypothetical protein